MQEKLFDIRGQICPSSLLIAMREVNANRTQLKTGEMKIVILTDNRDAVSTIPNTVTNMGYTIQVIKEPDHYRLEILKEVQ